jgi:hypothetical protein
MRYLLMWLVPLESIELSTSPVSMEGSGNVLGF